MSERDDQNPEPVQSEFESQLIEFFRTQVRRLENVGAQHVNGVALIVSGMDTETRTLHAVSSTMLPASDTADPDELEKFRTAIYDLMVDSFKRGFN